MTNCFLVGLSKKVAGSVSLLLIALLWVHYESAEGDLVQTPSNTTVIANYSTFFNCSKFNNKSEELTWHHYTVDGKAKGVYEAGSIRGTYKGRFEIEKNLTSGTFNLLVLRPEPTDAGRYACVEDPLEKDTGASAELVVLDSSLVCGSDKDLNEIVGPTACAKPIEPDQLQLSCSVTYSGNIPPRMQWRKIGSELESMGISDCGVRGNRKMCNATLGANLQMEGSVYICHIITEEQYNCSLKVNKTIYTFSDIFVRAVTTTEEAFCSANTSKDLPCSYKWYKDNKTEQLSQTLKPSNPGIYRCEAECRIRNETCAFTAMVINVSETESNKAGVIVGLPIVIAAIMLTIAIVVLCQYKKRKQRHHPKEMELAHSVVKMEVEPKEIKDREALPIQEPQIAPEEIEPLLASLEQASQPASSQNAPEDEVDSDDAIRKAFNSKAYIGKGLIGEIYGPGQYEDKQCACEKVMIVSNQNTQANEGEMAKAEQIINKGLEWKALDHDNLIKFYGVVLQDSAVYILIEYAAGGSVRNALKKCTDCQVNLPMTVLKGWATQIAKGMEYLHEKNIIHKNLDSVRILIMESFEAHDVMNKTLKISQFCLIDDNEFTTHAKEKYAFTAPEVFDAAICDKEGDVWSFGIVIWEILTKKQPYKDESRLQRIIEESRKGVPELEIPDTWPVELKEILIDCRNVESSNRPTFSEILRRLQE